MSMSALRRVVDWDGMAEGGGDEDGGGEHKQRASARRERKTQSFKVIEEREPNVETLKR